MVALSARQLCLGKVGNLLNFGADPCCHGNEIWPRRGDLDDYRLVSLIPGHRPILSGLYHDGHGNENVKTDGVLLRNRTIHGEFTVRSSSENMFVTVMIVAVIACGHHCRMPSSLQASWRRTDRHQSRRQKIDS